MHHLSALAIAVLHTTGANHGDHSLSLSRSNNQHQERGWPHVELLATQIYLRGIIHTIMPTACEPDDEQSSWTNTDSGGATTPGDAQEIDFVTLGMFIIGMFSSDRYWMCT